MSKTQSNDHSINPPWDPPSPMHRRDPTPRGKPRQHTPRASPRHPNPQDSPQKSTPPHLKKMEEEMSSDHTDDSPATAQKKQDWRAAKFVNEIWREQGFDTTFNGTLINSWVNPTHRLIYANYVPVLTYVKPPSDGYWDIPISPNLKYFLVFQPFELNLPEDRRLPMEFERLNLFHAKHG